MPGLAAKPIVDMVLEVADSADEAAYAPDLETAERISARLWFGFLKLSRQYDVPMRPNTLRMTMRSIESLAGVPVPWPLT